jgi:soluble lytic murein transglycosylase-like protein
MLAERIAHRYHLALPAAEYVVQLAGRHFAEEPTLLLAIVAVESSFRVWCRGVAGEVGLCQVRPDMHGPSAAELIDPEANIGTAARVLRACIRRAGGDKARGVAFYNGAGAAAERYATRVLAEQRKLSAA